MATKHGKVRRLDREELAWAAGFWEGEGSIACCASQGKRFPRLLLSLSQVEAEPLEKFRDIFGWGQVYGPYVFPSRPNRQPIRRYAIYGHEKVQATVAMLWPWLSSRRKEQASKALTAYVKAHQD